MTKNDIKDRNFDLDLTKLTINVTKTGLSGYEVDEILAKKYNIQVDCCEESIWKLNRFKLFVPSRRPPARAGYF